jgi:hypothetical protein
VYSASKNTTVINVKTASTKALKRGLAPLRENPAKRETNISAKIKMVSVLCIDLFIFRLTSEMKRKMKSR